LEAQDAQTRLKNKPDVRFLAKMGREQSRRAAACSGPWLLSLPDSDLLTSLFEQRDRDGEPPGASPRDFDATVALHHEPPQPVAP
jgi:hypothetical protein